MIDIQCVGHNFPNKVRDFCTESFMQLNFTQSDFDMLNMYAFKLLFWHIFQCF